MKEHTEVPSPPNKRSMHDDQDGDTNMEEDLGTNEENSEDETEAPQGRNTHAGHENEDDVSTGDKENQEENSEEGRIPQDEDEEMQEEQLSESEAESPLEETPGQEGEKESEEGREENPDTEAQDSTEDEMFYTPRRLIVTLTIGMPKDAIHRADLLTEQLNSFLSLARKCSTKHLRVIKYSEHKPIFSRDRKSWLKKFRGLGSDHLMTYTHGYYPWQQIRDGSFRFKLYLAIPLQHQDIDTYIKVLNDAWGDNQRATVLDVRGQDIYAPKKIGWLFRSHRMMANTRDLQEELNYMANRTNIHLKFGLNNQSLPDPNGGKWDPEKAVKAVMVETNEDSYDEAWSFLTKVYNGKESKPPFGIHMRFVGLKEHPEFRGNPHALHNISILMKRQAVFTADSVTTSTNKLVSIDSQIKGTKTLRMMLMELKPRCSGKDLREGRLFHSISRNITRAGNQEFHFTYNKLVQEEAGSIVSSICEFLRDELKIDPEYCCFAHFIRDDHQWDPITRTSTNPATEALNFMVEESKDLITRDETTGGNMEIDEDETMDEVDSKVARERQRCLGLNDEETIRSISKAKHRVIPSRVHGDARSVRSGISAITDLTSASKASRERKTMRSQLKEQQDMMKAQNDKIEKLMKLIAKTSISYEDGNDQNEDQSAQESGESSDSLKRNNPDGVINVDEDSGEGENGEDDDQSRGVRFDLPKAVDLQKESSSDSEEEQSDGGSEDSDASQNSDSDSSANSSKGNSKGVDQGRDTGGEEQYPSEDAVQEVGQPKHSRQKTNITAEMLDQAKKQKNQHANIEINATGSEESGFNV